ncbi:MAG TPA: RDD family protein [Gammaproteobacteria bacterium]|nr:RDD family protein [Gammaproteobacteria bacterium]
MAGDTANEDNAEDVGGDPSPEPAGLARRLAALVYDALLLVSVAVAYTLAVVLLRGGAAVPPGTWWFELGLAALVVLFFTWFWTHGGQTLGMQAWGLRVESAAGGPVTWRSALLRGAAGLVSLLAGGLGFWWALLDPEHRCWHDRLSGTRVVRVRRARAAPPADSEGQPGR